jgi:ABC-type dipeptide/oligopeptide/nickel transport system ATPase subunit
MAPVVELAGVGRTYRTAAGTVTPVEAASLTVAPGEVVGICGPSGTGKSTLLRLVAGLERPDAGEVRYGGAPAWPVRPWWRRSPRRAHWPRPGYVMPVFQDPFASLDPRWPIWRSITEPTTVGRTRRPSPGERRREAAGWLAQVGLDGLDPETRPAELSGGQCQRVAVVRALAARPALLVADEPTARQDVVTAAALVDLLTEVAAGGTAVIVVSHDTARLATCCSRLLRLDGGRLRDVTIAHTEAR